MKMKSIISTLLLTAGSSLAGEYHVAKHGNDTHAGSAAKPFLTIQHAADLAQPGDVITVHKGTYRERVNPPHGGTSDAQRIVYQAAPGESVVIKGSEIVTSWERVKDDVWKAVLPNSFFGDFNPFDDLISGDWFKNKGRDHHTGAVYLNGNWLGEAAEKEDLNHSAKQQPDTGFLFNVAWMRLIGAEENKIFAAELTKQQGIKKASSSEGGECIGFINDGDWAVYAKVDFGTTTEHMEFNIASSTRGGLVEIHLDSPQGDLLGTVAIPSTGGWQKWRTIKTIIVPTSGQNTVCLVFKGKSVAVSAAPMWFAEVDGNNTSIWAQFIGIDPNQELTEVNARQSVFYPENPGMNYITVRGFKMRHAATPWAPPTAEQIGLIGTHWSKGWIIEDNEISDSACVGITLGKYGDERDNKAGSADGYNGTIKRAISNGWNKATIGSHVVRNNDISHCDQAGIVGSLGAVFSTIHNNEIHDIYVNKNFAGWEIAGIKFHGSIDCVISQNHIYRCLGPGGGIWLDWMAQGTRVTGNLMHDNSIDLFLEVNHGPFLVDNNIFLSSSFLRNWSQGGAFVHNLVAGSTSGSRSEKRKTPFHKAHSTEIVKLSPIAGGDHRFINNVFMNGINLDGYEAFSNSVVLAGNAFLKTSPKLILQDGGFHLEVELDKPTLNREQRVLVTSDLLGRTIVSDQPFVQTDGTPYHLDTDYFGNKRNTGNPAPGPFEVPASRHRKVWPRDEKPQTSLISR